MPYLPIDAYGLIGDMHSVALVGRNGSIDWLCLPQFDSPSVFGALLDERRGGSFKISPSAEDITVKQLYWPETNVLITRFLSEGGVGELRDFMPVGRSEEREGRPRLIRQVHVVRGEMSFQLECSPAFDYGRRTHRTEISESGARFCTDQIGLGLVTRIPLRQQGSGVTAELVLREGESATFSLQTLTGSEPLRPPYTERQTHQVFRATVDFWRRWLSRCTYTGRWREMVHRSALALKLLTYEPSGAIVAAATCSLPERIGGERNWDYRYTWIRDAAFTVYGLLRIGFTEEAGRFMHWLEERCHDFQPESPLQIMYGIDGRRSPAEEVLGHLEGYRGSSPVRIGNAAQDQLQLDIHGELMDSVYLFNKYGAPISYDFWTRLRRQVDWVCDNWRQPDEGIWEVRGGRQDFVYSKMMCWVAVDRAIRLADRRSFPANRSRWLAVRDEIYEEILTKGWSPTREAFVQSYGSETLDASSLLMPLVFFMSANDPRMLKTLDAINRSPARGGLVSDGLVHRYDSERFLDGIPGIEGTFNICSFWLIEAMTRAGHTDPARLDDARILFEQVLGYANHLGLYAEQIGPTGEALGNFPQAFTHLGLISAAFNLDRALSARRG